jgi:hypothetical protein
MRVSRSVEALYTPQHVCQAERGHNFASIQAYSRCVALEIWEMTMLMYELRFADGVHHYDENGLKHPKDEPYHIQKIHREIVEFVTEWLKDWKKPSKD